MAQLQIDTVIKIAGFRELEKAFNTLPNAVSKRILRGAMKKALKPVAVDAKSKVPVRTGKLRDSIFVGTKLAPSQEADSALKTGHIRVVMGTEWPEGAHGHFVEFGTSKMVAQPYMRPAWDSNKKQVVRIIADESWKSLQRMAKRLFKQAKAGKLSKVGKRTLFG